MSCQAPHVPLHVSLKAARQTGVTGATGLRRVGEAGAPTWTSTVMGPLLSISRISPFLVPSRMCPCPSVMALMDGLSSSSRPVDSHMLVMLPWRPADDVTAAGGNLWTMGTARLS